MGRTTPTIYPSLQHNSVGQGYNEKSCDVPKVEIKTHTETGLNVFQFSERQSKDLKHVKNNDATSTVTVQTISANTMNKNSSEASILRPTTEQTISNQDRSERSKSTPVISNTNVTDFSSRLKLLSCPDEHQKQRLANEPSDKQTRRERICFLGREAADIECSEIASTDLLAIPGTEIRDSGFSNNDLHSPKLRAIASRGPDSGVFESSFEMSGEVSQQRDQSSVGIPSSSSRETSVERDFELSTEEESEKVQRKKCCTVLQAVDKPRVSQSKTHVNYLRLESSDSIFDEESCLPSLSEISEHVQDDLPRTEKRTSDSKPLYKRLISEGSVSVFDEYYDEKQPIELPNSLTLREHSINKNTIRNDLHSSQSIRNDDSQNSDAIDPNETITSESTLHDSDNHLHTSDSEPFERCLEKGEKLHRRLLSSLSAEIDISSFISDSELEGSMCSDCINRVERSSSVSVVSTSQSKRKRVPSFRKQTSLPAGTPGRCRYVSIG